MSWWVSLKDSEGNTVECQPHSEGGTYVVGGTNEATLNITYNYGTLFRLAMGDNGLKDIDGKKAIEVTPRLSRAVEALGTQGRDADYWTPTPGNAGRALAILLQWAREYPDAVFEVH